MPHINYFEPYERKPPNHEDHLTRAYLIVLRYSPSALLLFYDQVYNSLKRKDSKSIEELKYPTVSTLNLNNVLFGNQVKKIENFLCDNVVSILTTDEDLNPKKEIEESGRGFTYDGVIGFKESGVTFVIENKPRSKDVWLEQLNLNLKGMEVELSKVPAIIEWKEIIKGLMSLISSPALSGAEKLIIKDFLDYIDRHFGFLNPFETLELCKNNRETLYRRVRNILEDLVIEDYKNRIQEHTEWRAWTLILDFDEIKLIGLDFNSFGEGEEWEINLSINYGNIMSKASNFYKDSEYYLNLIKDLPKLEEEGWICRPEFHLSFARKHLVWYTTPNNQIVHFLEYWHQNSDEIRTIQRDEVEPFLSNLEKENLIVITEAEKNELDRLFYQTNRTFLYVCPSFSLTYPFSSKLAIQMDSKNELIPELSKLIKRGLSILNREIDFLVNFE